MQDPNKIIEKENNLSMFEDIYLRIPYIGENILRHLDDKSLSNLKLSCKSICAFIQYQRWFWIRIIQRYIGKIEDVDETWQTAIDKGQLISQHIFPDVRCTKCSTYLMNICSEIVRPINLCRKRTLLQTTFYWSMMTKI